MLPLALAVTLSWSARGAETPSITIDDSRAPIIVVAADHARIVDVIKELGSRFGFAIEHLPADSKQTVTATLKGELRDLLRTDTLGRLNYLLITSGSRVERLVFVGSSEPSNEAATQRTANTSNTPVREPSSGDTLRNASTLPAPNTPQSGGSFGRVNQLLHTQAAQGKPPNPTMTAAALASDSRAQASPAPAAQVNMSMAATVRTAVTNVNTLAAALRSTCIGPNCSH